MDVFSLVKFWRNAGIGDPLTSTNFDTSDDESSFFDLVFTNNNNDQCVDSTTINIISGFHTNNQKQQCFSNLDGLIDTKSKSNHTYYSCSSPHSIFFKNNKSSKILPLDNSSSSSSTTKSPKSPFRVLKLGFQNNNNSRKMKHESNNKFKNEIECDTCCVKEEVTISSLLKRDNSLRNKLKSEDHDHTQISSKRFSKEAVYKYLNIIKPSKRFHDKLRLPENSLFTTSSPATTSIKKYLSKSRSSSSAAVKPVPLRRDDSVLQQQDGIQSAILHCKRSYSSPSQGCQVLSRSGSAPSHGARISVDEEKRSSI